MSDARSRLIVEVSEDLERAADDLAYAVSDLFPERYVEISPFDDDDDDDEAEANGRRVITGRIEDRPDDEIDEAIESFEWTVRRVMKRLKEALAKEAADGR
jgi:hypothetical protein